jgi:hypothetical protein
MLAIVECQTSNRLPNIVTDRLAKMLMLIVERYSQQSNWRNYSYRDEMIADAICHLVSPGPRNTIPPVLRFDCGYAEKVTRDHLAKQEAEGWRIVAQVETTYTLEHSETRQRKTHTTAYNPLAWITSIVHHSFIKTLKGEKAQSAIRDEILIWNGADPSFDRQQKEHDDYLNDTGAYEPPKERVKSRRGKRRNVD